MMRCKPYHIKDLILAHMNAAATGDTEALTAVEHPCPSSKIPNRETIEAITQLIVERFQPEQIILFGSVACGDLSEIKTDLLNRRNHAA